MGARSPHLLENGGCKINDTRVPKKIQARVAFFCTSQSTFWFRFWGRLADPFSEPLLLNMRRRPQKWGRYLTPVLGPFVIQKIERRGAFFAKARARFRDLAPALALSPATLLVFTRSDGVAVHQAGAAVVGSLCFDGFCGRF